MAAIKFYQSQLARKQLPIIVILNFYKIVLTSQKLKLSSNFEKCLMRTIKERFSLVLHKSACDFLFLSKNNFIRTLNGIAFYLFGQCNLNE